MIDGRHVSSKRMMARAVTDLISPGAIGSLQFRYHIPHLSLRYNRGKSAALDRSALVEAGGGREPPRDAAATAIGRGKPPDIPGEDRCPEACLRVETTRFERRCFQNSAMIGSKYLNFEKN